MGERGRGERGSGREGEGREREGDREGGRGGGRKRAIKSQGGDYNGGGGVNYQRLIQTPSIVLHKRDTTCIYINNCVATYHHVEVRRQNLSYTHTPPPQGYRGYFTHRQFYWLLHITCTIYIYMYKTYIYLYTMYNMYTCGLHPTFIRVPVDHITGKDQHPWQELGGKGFKIYSHDQYPTQVCFVHTVSPWKPHYIHAGMYITYMYIPLHGVREGCCHVAL